MSEPTYTISVDGRAITCHRCGMTSHHPQDVQHRFCGNCKLFHEGAPAANTDLVRENAELRRRLDSARHAGDMEHARMAALIEACEAAAAFIESYTPDSDLARSMPGFYGLMRVYGKNARAAVQAVRPQADALLARLADMSRMIGEQNTTIGYQDAMLAERARLLTAAYHALQSYARGNAAPDLAIEVATAIESTLEKVSKE